MADYHAHGYDRMTDADLLDKVSKGWRCKETPCGTGSTVENSAFVRTVLPHIVEKYGVKSVCDVGAGDLNWMRLVNWGAVKYVALDLYPRHPDVVKFDATKEIPPTSDLILCRHVLNHLSIQFSEYVLANFAASGSRYMLMTNCENQRDYWKQYGLDVGSPIEKFKDCQHWELELYELGKTD